MSALSSFHALHVFRILSPVFFSSSQDMQSCLCHSLPLLPTLFSKSPLTPTHSHLKERRHILCLLPFIFATYNLSTRTRDQNHTKLKTLKFYVTFKASFIYFGLSEYLLSLNSTDDTSSHLLSIKVECL